MVYEWIDYDVAGSEVFGVKADDKYGYEGDEDFPRITLDIPDNTKAGKIIAALRKAGVFRAAANAGNISIDGKWGDRLFFVDVADGRPFGELRATKGVK